MGPLRMNKKLAGLQMKVFFYMPQLENISSSMGVTANARITHKLTNTGKLPGMAQIADYHSYNVKVAELLESHTLEYCKLQHLYGFRWGSNSQHLYTRFLLKRRAANQLNQNLGRHYTTPLYDQIPSGNLLL